MSRDDVFSIGLILGLILLAVLLPSPVQAFDEPEPLRVEIERNLPNGTQQNIVLLFADLEELLMWFEQKVEGPGCDPYVDKVTLFPKGP